MPLFHLFSYLIIMKQCWQMMPEERPTFTELYLTVSNIIERMAGYLQVGYNPFLGRGDEEKAEEMEEMEEEEEEEKEEKENNNVKEEEEEEQQEEQERTNSASLV